MKKLIILSIAFLISLSALNGQARNAGKAQTKEASKGQKVSLKKLEGSNVGAQAKTSFYGDFKNVPDVKWKRSGNFDEATFTKDGKQMTAFYDSDGKLVGTTSPAKFADLPEKAQQRIKKEYKDYSVGPVIFFDDNEANETDMILYGLQFADEDNYFVELTKGTDKIVVQVNSLGEPFFYTKLK
jgi:hypothetical protein